METTCIKCGVTICDKNKQRSNKNCKQCITNSKTCKVIYTSAKLNEESKKNAKRLQQKLWATHNKDRVNTASKRHYEKYPERHLERAVNYRKNNREKIRISIKNAYQKNIEKRRLDGRNHIKKGIESLSDTYLKSRLAIKNISSKEIPQELIELKRKQLTLYRYVQEQKKDINCQ